MVVVSTDSLSNTSVHQQQEQLLLNMNSTCAIGPTARHNFFSGGIMSPMDNWHQSHDIKQEPSQSNDEDSSPNKSTSSPTYNNGNKLSIRNSTSPTNMYNHVMSGHHLMHNQHQQYQLQIINMKSESNNNNENDDKSSADQQTLSSQAQGSDDSQLSSCSTGSENGSVRSPSSGPSPFLVDAVSDDPLRRLQMALQRTGIMTTPPPATSSNISTPANTSSHNSNVIPLHHNSEKPLQCPICTFSSTSRANFNTHLQSHEDQRSCSMCEFTAESTEQFKDHMRDAHDVILSGSADDEGLDEDEPGLTVPKINSQGKVKTFRCKQCDFCAVTKLEFWEHTREHIKQERRLTCPKCPFVTEYKHHLEYHLRNHFGSKPFKCDKCSYSCVNKSMLNSHLKSHSNVYQYRCSDCTYATKYCHSLKLHLRKYKHNPAMVLNPDGSPNPLPIVDVYGTRRGPKQRHSKNSNIDENSLSPEGTNSNSGTGPGIGQLHQLFPPPYIPFYEYSPLLNPLLYTASKAMLPTANNQDSNSSNELPSQHFDKNVIGSYFMNNNNNLNNIMNCNQNMKEQQRSHEVADNARTPDSVADTGIPIGPENEETDHTLRAPLDLSRSENEPDLVNNKYYNNLTETSTTAISRSIVSGTSGLPKTIGRNNERRRKGKAFKLDRLALRLQKRNSSSCDEQFDEDDDESIDDGPPLMKKQHAEDDSEDNNNNTHQQLQSDVELPLQCVLGEEEAEDGHDSTIQDDVGENTIVSELSKSSSFSKTNPNSNNNNNTTKDKVVSPLPSASKDVVSYNCSYCDISFKDVVMYTMHMGYHGFQDPYTCNMCGQQTSDRVSFFLHIARTSHS